MSLVGRESWWARIKTLAEGAAADGNLTFDVDIYKKPSPMLARDRRMRGNSWILLTETPPVPGTDFPFYFQQQKDLSQKQRDKKEREKFGRLFASLRTGTTLSIPIRELPPPEELLRMRKMLHPVLSAWKAAEDAEWLRASERRSGDFLFVQTSPATQYSQSMCGMLEEIQRHLLEDVIDEGQTWSLWSVGEVVGIVNERLRRFIVQTSILQKRATLSVVAGTSEYALPEDLLDLRRVGFRNGSTRVPLTPVDSWAADNGVPGWEALSETPYGYYLDPLDAMSLRILPTPSTSGSLDLIYVYAPEDMTTDNLCATLPIPSIFIPSLKYGVMADMLSKEGQANDPIRAEYCEERFKEGVELAKLLYGGTDFVRKS